MNKQTVLIAVIALLVGGIAGYALVDKEDGLYCGHMEKENYEQVPAGEQRIEGVSSSMMGRDHSGHMMAMIVESEREFIEGMIPHHQEAVDTAKEVIARGGTTPEIKVLVEAIVVAQEKEIAEMKGWYEAWYGEVYTNDNSYTPMMRELENLSGAELDKVFLEDMITHHMGAIMMAGSVESHIEHEEIAALAEAIKETQSVEINEMKQMFQDL